MKKLLLLFLCLTFHFGVFAQSEVFYLHRQPKNSVSHYKNALIKLKSSPPSFERDTSMANSYYHLAILTHEKQLQTINAFIDSTMHLSNKIKWEKGITMAYLAMGYLASSKQTAGLWDESEELRLKIIRFLRSKNDTKALNSAMFAWANNLWDIGKFDKSITILQECRTIAESNKDYLLLVLIYFNLGHNYVSKKMYPKAQSFYEKAYSIRNDFYKQSHQSSLDSILKLAEFKTYLIQVYILNKQKAKAEKKLPWVENIINQSDDFQKYYSNHLFAFSYFEIGEYKKAEKYALKAEKYAKPIASNAHDFVVATDLYKIYKGLGENDLALKYLEELKKVETAINFDKMNAKVTELQLKYDTETKQKEIDQLTIKQQSQTQKSLFAGLGILIIITGYVFWNYRKLLHKNREISEAMLQGQTTERRRVAIDLHDNLGSTLSSIGWSMDTIDKSKMTKSEQKIYQNLKEMIVTAYNEVRLLSHNLLPEELEKQGLIVALQTFCKWRRY